MPRNPNDPIPGFEDEYTGTVGREKAVHHNHFTAPGTKLRKRENDDEVWIEIRPGRWKLRIREH